MEDGLKLYSDASQKCSVGGGVRGGEELYGRQNTISSPSLASPFQKPLLMLPHLLTSQDTEEPLGTILGPLPISVLIHPHYDLIQAHDFKYHLFILIISSDLSSVPQICSSPPAYLTSQ